MEARPRMQQRQRQIDVGFQQEVRQKLDDQGAQLQQMALAVQDIRAHQTPQERIEQMVGTRVSTEVFAAFRADVSTRLDKLERAPDANAATNRANLGIAISLAALLVMGLCSGVGLFIQLLPHLH